MNSRKGKEIMIHAIAIDDELHALERLSRLLMNHSEVQLQGLFETAEDALSFIEENPVDVVFLDIEMPGKNGLLLAEDILDRNDQINIVFVTAYQEYALQAFELHAMDYLVKPLTEVRLEKTLRHLTRERQNPIRPEKAKIRCFSQFTLSYNKEIIRWNNSKAKELLAFLVHKRGVPVDWEKIADALWPDFSPPKAQTNFHATNYLLRKALARSGLSQIYENGRGNYRIRPEQVDCDYYEFLQVMEDKSNSSEAQKRRHEVLTECGGLYLEEDGYEWAYPAQAELERNYKKLMKNVQNPRGND